MMRKHLLCALSLSCVMGLMTTEVFAESEVDLLAVNQRLYELGYRDDAGGAELDEETVNALRNFQQANSLGITGEADPGTVLVLHSDSAISEAKYIERVADSYDLPELSAGDYGQEVLRLQETLMALGYMDKRGDGNFDSDTTEAVCRFQLANGLELTGKADSTLCTRLYGGTPVAWQSFLDSCQSHAGESGEKVRLLQRWLKCTGLYDGDCTANFGEETQRAVREFQQQLGLSASGDADSATIRALFGDVCALCSDAATLRRGMPGAQALCEGLSKLGYMTHQHFDMQTELALMQFQFANGMAVTGTADESVITALSAPNAVGRAGFVATAAVSTQDFPQRLAHEAAALLGEVSGFDDEFGLVQYVYLRCGVAVLDISQLSATSADVTEARAGDVMVAEFDGGEHCGIVIGDGGLIYRDPSTRIVTVYPQLRGATTVKLCRVAGME